MPSSTAIKKSGVTFVSGLIATLRSWLTHYPRKWAKKRRDDVQERCRILRGTLDDAKWCLAEYEAELEDLGFDARYRYHVTRLEDHIRKHETLSEVSTGQHEDFLSDVDPEFWRVAMEQAIQIADRLRRKRPRP